MEFDPENELFLGNAEMWDELLDAPGAPRSFVAHASEQARVSRRAGAIVEILANADFDAFTRNLVRGAQTWDRYLARCETEGHVDFLSCASRTDAFFDALAGGDLELARELAKRSQREHSEGHEYEEDFWYGRVLHALTLGEDELAPMLEAFEGSLADQPRARFDVCEALANRDARAFEAAFDDLVDVRATEVSHERNVEFVEELGHLANHAIFIEGLAVLRLAESLGLPTRRAYDMCPELARLRPLSARDQPSAAR